MERRSVGTWLLGCLVLAGCGSSPEGQELAEDHAADFAGIWYGSETWTYQYDDGSTNTSTHDLSEIIVVTGKNALQLPAYCTASDPGVSATVTSATHFEMKQYQCGVSEPGYCPLTVKVHDGGGTLSGSTLHLEYHGSIEVVASQGCRSTTVSYDLVFSGTHTPPDQSVQPPSRPENVSVSKSDWYGRFDLSWTLSGPPGQIEVQARVGNGAWQDVGLLYSSTTFVELNNPPERTPVAFRVRNTIGSEHSDWSEEVSENTGLRPPQVNNATSGNGEIQFIWVPRQDVTGLAIERSTGIGMTGWAPLTTLAPSVGSYTDAQLDELQSYAYRLRWVDGAIEGYRATLYPLNTGVRPPTGLAAVPGVERVDLSWQNHSTAATEIVVVRAPGLSDGFGGLELAHLPATATSFTDMGLATGLYRYEVQARVPGSSGRSSTVPVATLPPAGSWETSIIDFPADDLNWMPEAAIDNAPRVLAWSLSAGLVGSDSPAWLPHLTANMDIGAFPVALPVFELDAAFHPHLVWMRNTVQGTNEVAVMHEWFDGNVWRSEELARWLVGTWAHALDASGRPVVVTSSASGLRALRWNGSAYAVEDTGVSLAPNVSLRSLQVAVSPEGVVHFLLDDIAGGVVHAWRDTAWKKEAVTAPSSTASLQQIMASTGDRLTVTYFDWVVPQVQLVEKSGGAWSAPITISSSTFFPGRTELRLETSVTGAHPTLAIATASGLQIARPGDGWTLHPLTGTAPLLGVGYDGADRLWVLVQGGANFSGTTYLALFREK